MTLVNSIFTWLMKKRIHQIELFIKYPIEVQQEWFRSLTADARETEWGRKFDYKSIHNYQTFQERVPIQTYESLHPYIERMIAGETNILWHSDIKWFAKSSGTTNNRSKFIPVSPESLEECHFKGGKDLITLYCHNNAQTKIFTGKSLVLGGSHQINQLHPDTFYGDLSAVIIKNLPIWAEFHRTPDLSIALMENYEEKIEKMAEATKNVNVTNIAGVPTWTILLARKILEITGEKNLLAIWPNLELYTHGGVSFNPYQEQFNNLIPSSTIHYIETYNASEGFFGIQDRNHANDLLLMLDYGIFYEFIPLEQIQQENPKAITLDDVEIGKNYALVISTNGGLWRYLIGDTIRFTSTNPYRIQITGRTKHFINAFGEELIIENAENALKIACKHTQANITDYTACPIYFDNKQGGGHEWVIEFEKEPNDMELFTYFLDETLKKINSDYEAKRFKDLALRKPIIHKAPPQTFYNWMKKRNKLGGQHKVPRLANDRSYVEEILKMIL